MNSLYSPSERLIIALKKKNFDEAKRLIDEEGANIDERNVRGETAVFMFAHTNSLNALNWLIENNANLDIPNKNGDTPLLAAVTRNDLNVVDTLLSAGADVDKMNKRNISPVMQAVLSEKDNGVLDRLLEANPNVDQVSSSNTTPLLAAAARGKINYVEKLIDAGADPEAADYLGQGLLHAAILSHDPNVLSAVIKKAPLLDPNYAARSGTTAMSLTIGQPTMTSMLLEIGGDPNAQTSNRIHEGATLLMSIISSLPSSVPLKKKGDEDSMQMAMSAVMGAVSGSELVVNMINKGAQVDVRDEAGRNAGYFAVVSGAVDTLPNLIAAGLDPKRPLDASSTLPYDVLCSPDIDRDSEEALNLIEEWHSMGFDFERPQWDEQIDGPWTATRSEAYQARPTVLQNFANVNFWEGIKKAVSLGANINEKGVNNNTFAHMIVSSGYDGMDESLKRALSLAMRVKNIDESTKEQQLNELKETARENLNNLREFLNNSHIDWNAKTSGGNTPLHIAASKGDQNWAQYLMMDIGVDPTIKNEEGLTAAGVALKNGKIDMFYALAETAKLKNIDLYSGVILDTVQASSDDFRERQPWLKTLASLDLKGQINEVNEDGQSPLYIAAATDQHDVVRTLLKLGADPNQQDNAGNTPIMQAVFNEGGEVIRLLRAGGANPSIENKQGQNAYDVADYVKEVYVHRALNDDDLGELIQDVAINKPTQEEIEARNIFNIKLQNVVRTWTGEELLEVPTISSEENVEEKSEKDTNNQVSNARVNKGP